MRVYLSILSLLLLSACAIQPRHFVSGCAFKRQVIDVRTPAADDPETVAAAAMTTSEQSVLNALRASGSISASTDGRPVDPAMLFLSGGSQHGAFGAGYLTGWKEKAGALPKFAVVTGISTGAILSTFAFVNEPQVMAAAYSIRTERILLTPLVSTRGGSPTPKGYVGVIRKGAIADLAPLRIYLDRVLTDDILTRVALAAREQRILRVGVVDVDTGQAVALDLVDMARRWSQVEAQDVTEKARLKACYVEAIVASSSAPLAALPVFIDDRMYVDGGARFGAFSNEFESVLALNARDSAPLKPRIYLLINGDQRLDSRCGRADAALCTGQGDPPGAAAGSHAKWNLLSLALRSEQILANQVYRFSADSIAYLANRQGLDLHYVQIDADMDTHSFLLDDADLGHERMTCRQAHDRDKALLDPVQFYPRYMRCLVDYGSGRGAAEWGAGH